MSLIFFSYSHKDEALRDKLEIHLAMLKRQNFIETWHDRRIDGGENVDRAIDENLEKSDIILALISPDFLASDYCYDVEMIRALERHQNQEAVFIPIILRVCDWHDAPFGKLMATPTDGKPIVKWADADEAFNNVVQTIKKVVGKQAKRHTDDDLPKPIKETVGIVNPVRSSNLAIKKEFSEKEKRAFIQDSFDFVAKYFENSLEELENRNPEIETSYRKIDANRFTCNIYKNGTAESSCTIYLGGIMGSDTIGFNNKDDGNTNSLSAGLSVGMDSQQLYLNPQFMMENNHKDRLSREGGAELFWSKLIKRLQ